MMQFLREYIRYLREVRLRQCMADWARHFAEEILKSPVNQVSLVLGVVGISGVITALSRFIWARPVLPLVAAGCGAIALLFLSMASFHLSRRAAVSLTEDAKAEMQRLLRQLMRRGKMTNADIGSFLRTSEHMTLDLVGKAKELGWIEQWSGTWKVNEAMKPILRRQMREKEEE